MKNGALFLCFILAYACQQRESKLEEEENEYQLRIEQELKKSIRNDTIFLDYRFGMTEQEFRARTRQLINESKLYRGSNGQLAYKMVFDENEHLGTAEAALEPDYFEGMLYQLSISVEPPNFSSPALTQAQLLLLYMKKYGAPVYERPSLIDDRKNYYWLDANRQIELVVGIDDVRILYTDLTAKRKQEANEKAIKKKELKETADDI